MATTYTNNAQFHKPATSDRNWDVPINANTDLLDGMTAIGGLAVTTTEVPSSTLQVAVAPGYFINSSGLVVAFAGIPALVLPSASTTCLWLSDVGSVVSGSSFPASAHVRLAQVISGPFSILQRVDQRVQCTVAGTGLGYVLKSGDTINGSLAVASPGTGIPLVVADSINRLIGFFGASPASQAPALNLLTVNSSGVASDSLADVGAAFSQSALNNNFASLAAKVDALIVALKRHGLMGS